MILGRLFNSLQYRLFREEQEWRKTNKLRQQLAFYWYQRFLLKYGRRPRRWGIWILFVALGLTLFTGVVSPKYWTLITVEKFQVKDPSAFFIGLWAIQAAIAALVYPIVIAFVTVLLQLSNNAKADLNIYLHDSAAVPAGLSALLLILIMGCQYFALPYVPETVVFFWASVDVFLFVFNSLLTIRFLLHTFDFILPSKRDETVRRYAINVALLYWQPKTLKRTARSLSSMTRSMPLMMSIAGRFAKRCSLMIFSATNKLSSPFMGKSFSTLPTNLSAKRPPRKRSLIFFPQKKMASTIYRSIH